MQNTSGIDPIEYRVLVLPEVVEEKTAGGIFLPEQAQDKEKWAQMKAQLVAVSEHAFSYEPDWSNGTKPVPGDKVLLAKYAGVNVRGRDGVEYRIVNDKDITAKIEE